jgi:hypothetical protein
MENLYMYFCTVYGLQSQRASGFNSFFLNDVSTGTGCINRVVPSTLR